MNANANGLAFFVFARLPSRHHSDHSQRFLFALPVEDGISARTAHFVPEKIPFDFGLLDTSVFPDDTRHNNPSVNARLNHLFRVTNVVVDEVRQSLYVAVELECVGGNPSANMPSIVNGIIWNVRSGELGKFRCDIEENLALLVDGMRLDFIDGFYPLFSSGIDESALTEFFQCR